MKLTYFIHRRYPPSDLFPVFVEGEDEAACEEQVRAWVKRFNDESGERKQPYYCPALEKEKEQGR